MKVHVIHIWPVTVGEQVRDEVLNVRQIVPPQAKHPHKGLWIYSLNSLVACFKDWSIVAGATTWLVVSQAWNVVVVKLFVADFEGVNVAVTMLTIVASCDQSCKLCHFCNTW